LRHCCIIGGSGFIGSHVVEALLLQGRRITVVGRNPVPSRTLPTGVDYVPGDYGQNGVLRNALRDANEVIALAYSSVPKTSFEDPVEDIVANLPAAVRLFEIASRAEIKKLVLISSGGTVYGRAYDIPIRENHPTNPICPYGITKLATEKYGMMFNELKALPFVCVRPANAYGERQEPFVEQGFVATAIASVLRQQDIPVFGDEGTIRDYIHVDDVANGIIAALEKGVPGSCYNIGSGVGRSNKDVLDAIGLPARSVGLKPRIKMFPPRDFDVPVNVLDSTKLRKETGWKPTVSFEEGIERTWNWFYRMHSLKE